MSTDSAKQQIRQLLQQAQGPVALEIGQQLVRNFPNDAECWFLLGLCHAQAGNPADAEQAYRQCIKLQADVAAAWDNLGLVLLQQGRFDEAVKVLSESIRLNPDSAIPHSTLGQVHRFRGDLQQSLSVLEHAIRLDPDYAEAQHQLGITLWHADRLPEAIDHVRIALRHNPASADCWQTLGQLLHRQADFEGALNAYQRGLNIAPQALTWLGLGQLMEELNRREAARTSYTRAIELFPGMLQAHLRLGSILRIDGDLDAARRHLEQALGIKPGFPAAIAEFARLLASCGEYAAAYKKLQPLLQGAATPLDVATVFADICRPLGQEQEAFELLETIGQQLDATHGGLEDFLFARARLHEYFGNNKEAFQLYSQAHNQDRLPNDIDRHLMEMDAIRDYFSRKQLASLPSSDLSSQCPVFIVGMPRSGTSLVEQILAAHPEVYGGGELPTLWELVRNLPAMSGSQDVYPRCLDGISQQAMAQLAQQYLDKLGTLDQHAARVTDKLPHNFIHLGLIQLLLPHARIIHCTRDPLDTCLSIWTQKFNTSHLYARDLASLGRYYRAYEQLMEHWHRTLAIPMLSVRYEALVDDPEGESRRMLAFCELDWDAACLEFHRQDRVVNTPSHAQVRRPLYRSSVHRWRRFENWLGPLQQALGADAGG